MSLQDLAILGVILSIIVTLVSSIGFWAHCGDDVKDALNRRFEWDGHRHKRTKAISATVPAKVKRDSADVDVDSKSRDPLPLLRSWECKCGQTWQEVTLETKAEFDERMAELDIAESDKAK